MDQQQVNITALRQLLNAQFSLSELQELCTDLGIDHENVPGNTKVDKARELIAYAQRRSRMVDLVALARYLRPDADWQSAAPYIAPVTTNLGTLVSVPKRANAAEPVDLSIANLTPADLLELANILVRSGRADYASRRALCIEIQVESSNLSFLDHSASSDFAQQLIDYLYRIDNAPALLRLCDAMNSIVHGQLAAQLATIRAKIVKL